MAEPPSPSTVDALLERYRAYLIAERGLEVVTTVVYADRVRPFVASRLCALATPGACHQGGSEPPRPRAAWAGGIGKTRTFAG